MGDNCIDCNKDVREMMPLIVFALRDDAQGMMPGNLIVTDYRLCVSCGGNGRNVRSAATLPNAMPDYSHWAVSTQGEPLDLRVDVEWAPNVPGFRVTVCDMKNPRETFGTFTDPHRVIPEGTPSDHDINVMVRDTLEGHGSNIPQDVEGYAILSIQRFCVEWDFKWVEGRYA